MVGEGSPWRALRAGPGVSCRLPLLLVRPLVASLRSPACRPCVQGGLLQALPGLRIVPPARGVARPSVRPPGLAELSAGWASVLGAASNPTGVRVGSGGYPPGLAFPAWAAGPAPGLARPVHPACRASLLALDSCYLGQHRAPCTLPGRCGWDPRGPRRKSPGGDASGDAASPLVSALSRARPGSQDSSGGHPMAFWEVSPSVLPGGRREELPRVPLFLGPWSLAPGMEVGEAGVRARAALVPHGPSFPGECSESGLRKLVPPRNGGRSGVPLLPAGLAFLRPRPAEFWAWTTLWKQGLCDGGGG